MTGVFRALSDKKSRTAGQNVRQTNYAVHSDGMQHARDVSAAAWKFDVDDLAQAVVLLEVFFHNLCRFFCATILRVSRRYIVSYTGIVNEVRVKGICVLAFPMICIHTH